MTAVIWRHKMLILELNSIGRNPDFWSPQFSKAKLSKFQILIEAKKSNDLKQRSQMLFQQNLRSTTLLNPFLFPYTLFRSQFRLKSFKPVGP